MSAEEWRPVLGYEGLYEVSDRGRVKRLSGETRNAVATWIRPERILKSMVGNHGYPYVFLLRQTRGKKKARTVHSLVMEAFVGPRPAEMEVCHKNGNKVDSRLENLRYDTRSANGLDSVKHGTNKWANKTHCPRGHEYTPENTHTHTRRSGPKAGKTFRACRICAQRRASEWRSPAERHDELGADK